MPRPVIQQIVFALWRNRCVYCGEEFPFEELTREHLIPKSDGGSDAWRNIAPACKPCNTKRGNRGFEDKIRLGYYLGLAERFAKKAKVMNKYSSDIYGSSTLWTYYKRDIAGAPEFELMRAPGQDDGA